MLLSWPNPLVHFNLLALLIFLRKKGLSFHVVIHNGITFVHEEEVINEDRIKRGPFRAPAGSDWQPKKVPRIRIKLKNKQLPALIFYYSIDRKIKDRKPKTIQHFCGKVLRQIKKQKGSFAGRTQNFMMPQWKRRKDHTRKRWSDLGCCLNVNLSVWLSIPAIAAGSGGASATPAEAKCVEGKFHLQISCCHLINEMWDKHTHTQIHSQWQRECGRVRQMQRCSNRYWQHFFAQTAHNFQPTHVREVRQTGEKKNPNGERQPQAGGDGGGGLKSSPPPEKGERAAGESRGDFAVVALAAGHRDLGECTHCITKPSQDRQAPQICKDTLRNVFYNFINLCRKCS